MMDEEELKTIERDLRYLNKRIDRAIEIDLATARSGCLRGRVTAVGRTTAR
jgi:hypothetical protein